jgi:NADH-quinone oxidoreductase subunit K
MTSVVPLHHFLVVGAALFALGLIGFLSRRNMIVMFLCAEMMLQGVAINLAAFARFRGNLEGQAFVLFVITVAACEAALALALILMLFRSRSSLDVSLWQELRENSEEAAIEEEPPSPKLPEPSPTLTPAGLEPVQRPEKSHA